MKWEDKGILIAISKFGDTDQLATFITSQHGLTKGLIRGGISKKQKPFLQIGNEFSLIWKSRLEEHLGFFSFDPIKIYGATLFDEMKKLEILSCCCTLLYDSLAENHPNNKIYQITQNLFHNLETEDSEVVLLYKYMLWEKELLADLGFALSLDKCNATGTTENLYYISPKTGHAVCQTAGEPYRSRLLKMPLLWKNDTIINKETVTKENIAEALKVLEYFFDSRVYCDKTKPLPYIRRGLIK